MKTLEDFLEHECGMVTPKLLETFEPHREFIEAALTSYELSATPYQNEDDRWDSFSDLIWKFLPEPKKDHFTH